jgi:hypothetical protein
VSTELRAASGTATGAETTPVPAAVLADRVRSLHLPVGRSTAWRRIRQSGILLARFDVIVVGALLSDHFFEFDNRQRLPPDGHRRLARHRHDVRDPHGRDRPVGRIDRRLLGDRLRIGH